MCSVFSSVGLPDAMSVPALMRMMSLQYSASSRKCVVTRTVTPSAES